MKHHLIYHRAIAEIEKCGWCQKQYNSPKGEICLMTALSRAFFFYPDRDANHALVLHRLLKKIRTGIVSWNDTPGRTKEEVIDVLRQLGTPEPPC